MIIKMKSFSGLLTSGTFREMIPVTGVLRKTDTLLESNTRPVHVLLSGRNT